MAGAEKKIDILTTDDVPVVQVDAVYLRDTSGAEWGQGVVQYVEDIDMVFEEVSNIGLLVESTAQFTGKIFNIEEVELDVAQTLNVSLLSASDHETIPGGATEPDAVFDVVQMLIDEGC